MSKEGISIQSHTCTHPDLTQLSDRNLIQELKNSKNRILDEIGISPRHLAYPYGLYDQRVMLFSEEVGYRSGWAAGMAAQGRFSRERFQIKSNDGLIRFAIKTSKWGGYLRRIRSFINF
jgi:peptidoglycan/xylan/chitin deacetylase (PgdA/CDA1 family)